MLRIFLKKSQGSISVFVTMIMVPVVFLTGFLVDLSRIKFCGSQAVMAADNYGEAILTDYDNLLKELYGLFALTQNKEGAEALDRLDDYVQTYCMTSFQPNENRVSFSHLEDWTQTPAYEGWMPYQDAQVSLTAIPAEGATLSEPEVFNTQIGDFMKFRIVQTIGDDSQATLDAIQSVQNMQKDIEAVEKRAEVADKAAEVLKLAQDYYAKLEAVSQYPDYIRDINAKYSNGTSAMDYYISAYYPPYRDYQLAGPEEVEAALEHRAEIKEAEEEAAESETEADAAGAEDDGDSSEEESSGDSLSEEEEALCEIGDAYYDSAVHPEDNGENLNIFLQDCRNPVQVLLVKNGKLETTYQGGGYLVYDGDGNTQTVINFENLETKVYELQKLADSLEKKMGDLAILKAELEEILNDDKVSADLKKGMQDEMAQVNELFEVGGYYSADNYWNLAYDLDRNFALNTAYWEQAQAMYESMEEVANACLSDEHPDIGNLPEYEDPLGDPADNSNWWDFKTDSYYKRLYQDLRECFGDASADNHAAEQKKKEGENLLNSVGDKLKEDDTPVGTRDIPAGFGMGDGDKSEGFDILNMIGDAGKSFSGSSLSDIGNRLWTKLYLTQYDLSMFTSRVTNVKKTSAEEGAQNQEETVEESLTGYPKAPNINYLYQAEIEYLLGGHNSSRENLNEARNKILAFRATMNFAATYTVADINNLINEVSSAAGHPILVLVLNGVLRLAVAGVETYADWTLLKDGEAVCVLKTKMADLSVLALPEDLASGLTALIGDLPETEEKNKSFSLNYEQYLLIMMIFLTRSETLSQRSADLITLNVNTVKQKIGSEGTLEQLTFRFEDTVTAVDVTCSVQLDMVVMPKGFAQAVVGDDTFAALRSFEENTYKFTVTRGY